MIKRKSFTAKLEGLNLGIDSRKGSKAVISIPQIGWDGKELDKEAVSKQSFILRSTGKNELKIDGAFHRDSPLCAYLKNEASDKVSERKMPVPLIKIEDVEDITSAPKSVRDAAKGGKVPNWQYISKDKDGNVVAEAKEDDNGNWYKIEYSVPLYKQRFNNKYERYTEDKLKSTTGMYEKDDEGVFFYTFNEYCYVSLCNVGIFNGHEIDKAGNKIANTEGTYLVEGGFDESQFSRVTPNRSGAKISIKSRLNKVLAHPIFGVVNSDDISKAGFLKKGTFTYEGKAVTIAVYDSTGEVVANLVDRASYKINDFVAKKQRGAIKETNDDIAESISNAEAEINDVQEVGESVEDIADQLGL